MMTESERDHFNNRVCIGHVLVSANVYVTPVMTESAAEVELNVPDDDCLKEIDLYNRICQFTLLIGEIDSFPVFFNSRGFYFYWNKETEYLLESWLTFTAYPYGWQR